jgi:hypothetical protein
MISVNFQNYFHFLQDLIYLGLWDEIMSFSPPLTISLSAKFMFVGGRNTLSWKKDYPKITTNYSPQKIQDPQAQAQFLLYKSRN